MGEGPRRGRRSSPRVDAILARVRPGLPIWDLCCDGGQIGSVALDRDPAATVVFVDVRPAIVRALESLLARFPHYTGRYRVVCADILRMDLPTAPAAFVVAGVGTDLTWAFVQRLAGRQGDCIVASTSQCPTRFEETGRRSGCAVEGRQHVSSRHGRQTIWSLTVGPPRLSEC